MDVLIRDAHLGDEKIILSLIKGLAEYEKGLDQVVATEELLRDSLFCESPAVFAHIAEVDGEAVGFALWFLNYSTWLGKHGMYLEDIYVKPEYRGSGIGQKLLKHLARHAVGHGYGRLEWWCLDWNSPAIEFYKGAGAQAMDEWTVYRLTGEVLREFASAE